MHTTAVAGDMAFEALLQQVVQRTVGAFAPEQVILFGSQAEGRSTQNSDLDLLVIMPRRLSLRARLARTRGLFRDLPLPVQVITISRRDFERTRDVVGGIAYPAAKYGRVVYDQPRRHH
jgi:predicted nucleotidyltransferase